MMSSEDREKSPNAQQRRIVVLFDASPPSLQALSAARDLAARLNAELHAIYVEETDLLRSSAFDFAREISILSGSSRPLQSDDGAGNLRRHLRRLRAVLDEVADAGQVRYRLLVRRGEVVREVLDIAGPDDVLVLGRVGWGARLGRSIGSTSLMLARQAPGSVLIWSEPVATRASRVVMLAEAPETVPACLALACDRARVRGSDLSILLCPLPDAHAASERERLIERHLASFGIRAHMQELPVANTANVLQALGRERAVELVVSRRGGLLDSPVAERLLERIRLPVSVAA